MDEVFERLEALHTHTIHARHHDNP
jgi:hypothetical protein